MGASLFQPVKIKSLRLRNRLIMAPMGVCLASETGAVRPPMVDFFRKRARGGVGLIFVGGGQVGELRPPGNPAIHDDQMIPGLNDLVEAVQDEGAAIGIQLNFSYHYLPKTHQVNLDNFTPEEIEKIIQAFVKAAVRAQEAGFDVVEFHGAHGYLLSDFFSPLGNHRTDSYGGDAEKRRTFPLEILRRARKAVGSEFPLFFRINGSDFQEGGTVIAEAMETARRLEETGADAIDVSGGRRPFSDQWTIAPMCVPPGYMVHLAESIKKVVKVPVITAGKIDISLAARIIEEERADLVAMGRELIADPFLFKKAAEGRLSEIRNCIYCNYCVTKRTRLKKRIRCSINASVGRESDLRLVEAKEKKKVLIVGGGPAGLECARTLARRGHEVILKERQDHLGGQTRLASIIPEKEIIGRYISYLENELDRLGVRLEVKAEFSPRDIDALKPDAVILATGGLPLIPPIPGIDQEEVKTGFEVLMSGGEGLGRKVVVLGGGEAGCEMGEFLATKGKKITIIEQLNEIGISLEIYAKRFFLDRMGQYRMEILTGQKVARIEEKRIYLAKADGHAGGIEFDHVVLCTGTVADNRLWKELASRSMKVYQIGDCVEPKNIAQAVYQGAKIGRSI